MPPSRGQPVVKVWLTDFLGLQGATTVDRVLSGLFNPPVQRVRVIITRVLRSCQFSKLDQFLGA